MHAKRWWDSELLHWNKQEISDPSEIFQAPEEGLCEELEVCSKLWVLSPPVSFCKEQKQLEPECCLRAGQMLRLLVLAQN